MAGLASNVCGSVFGLLRIDDACTYFPPTCAMTSAYSFSAPMAVIFAVDAAAAVVPRPDALDEGDDDEQALASSAAASGRATARAPERVRMTLYSRMGKRRSAADDIENEHRYGNHFH